MSLLQKAAEVHGTYRIYLFLFLFICSVCVCVCVCVFCIIYLYFVFNSYLIIYWPLIITCLI